MKTIPLKTLLESVTPLPWHDKSWLPIQGKQFWANQAYCRHCCNHFPELVEALKWVRGSLLEHSKKSRACGYNFTVSLQEIDRALASAETVQIEN